MTYLNKVILYCLTQLQGERSIYSIYHILKGKKSSQSIQDTHIFNLHPFFHSLPSLKRDFFNEKVNELMKMGYVTFASEMKANITPKGKKIVENEFKKNFFPSNMNGLTYGDQTIIFWKRLSLFVQVVSNLKHQEVSYFPVQRDRSIQQWVKHYLRQAEYSEGLAKKLYDELYHLLRQLKETEDPSIVVLRINRI